MFVVLYLRLLNGLIEILSTKKRTVCLFREILVLEVYLFSLLVNDSILFVLCHLIVLKFYTGTLTVFLVMNLCLKKDNFLAACLLKTYGCPLKKPIFPLRQFPV